MGSQRLPVLLPTVHAVAVTNLLLAASAVIALGAEPGTVVEALAGVAPPPGRLEVIGRRDGVTAMVDTAHNPAALRTALTAVRARTEGRVLLVVGVGGERDRAKRTPMGEIAAELADLVVLADDNPRREPPVRIRAEVRDGCPDSIPGLAVAREKPIDCRPRKLRRRDPVVGGSGQTGPLRAALSGT